MDIEMLRIAREDLADAHQTLASAETAIRAAKPPVGDRLLSEVEVEHRALAFCCCTTARLYRLVKSALQEAKV